MEQFNIKVQIYKYGIEPMIHSQLKISKKNNPNFQTLLKMLGEPKKIAHCKCPNPQYGWIIQGKTLTIED